MHNSSRAATSFLHLAFLAIELVFNQIVSYLSFMNRYGKTDHLARHKLNGFYVKIYKVTTIPIN